MSDVTDELLTQDAKVLDTDLRSPQISNSIDTLWLAAQAEARGVEVTPPRRPPLRRRVVAAVLGLVVIGVGVTGGPAFAEWVGLHTGKYDLGPLLHRGQKTPEKEFWRMDSPELVPHLRAWEQDYPLAPGYSLDPLIDNYATNFTNSQMPASGFRTDVFLYSECTWVDAWLEADKTGDIGAKDAATEGFAATVAKLDNPVPIGLDEPGRAFLVELVEAARTDDAAPLKQEHRINCDWNFR